MASSSLKLRQSAVSSLNMKIGVFYGTTTGNTEGVAYKVPSSKFFSHSCSATLNFPSFWWSASLPNSSHSSWGRPSSGHPLGQVHLLSLGLLQIAEKFGVEAEDIASTEPSSFTTFDTLICGAPTWHTDADTERSGTDWDGYLYSDIASLDLKGKKVAFFGCGDSQGYGDNFCDAMGELHDVFTKTGASVIGMVPVADSVECEASKVGPLKITSAVSELALNTLTTGHHQRQVCGSCHR